MTAVSFLSNFIITPFKIQSESLQAVSPVNACGVGSWLRKKPLATQEKNERREMQGFQP
jgi:hypothetical protein